NTLLLMITQKYTPWARFIAAPLKCISCFPADLVSFKIKATCLPLAFSKVISTSCSVGFTKLIDNSSLNGFGNTDAPKSFSSSFVDSPVFLIMGLHPLMVTSLQSLSLQPPVPFEPYTSKQTV